MNLLCKQKMTKRIKRVPGKKYNSCISVCLTLEFKNNS